jgi:hypothetical protein
MQIIRPLLWLNLGLVLRLTLPLESFETTATESPVPVRKRVFRIRRSRGKLKFKSSPSLKTSKKIIRTAKKSTGIMLALLNHTGISGTPV